MSGIEHACLILSRFFSVPVFSAERPSCTCELRADVCCRRLAALGAVLLAHTPVPPPETSTTAESHLVLLLHPPIPPAMSLVYHGTPRLYPEAGPSLPLQPPPSIAASASPSLLVPGLPSGPARSGAGSPAIVLEGTDGASWNMRGSGMRVAAIRFPKPVRLNSLRIVPAGVRCPLGVG